MLEVLVAVLVLSVGLLGLAALQARGLQFSSDAYTRSQATILVQRILEEMRAARGLRPHAAAKTDMDAFTDTSAGSVAEWWHTAVRDTLPGGAAIISVNGTDINRYDIEVRWWDRQIANQAQCGATASRVWDNTDGVCLVQSNWTVLP